MLSGASGGDNDTMRTLGMGLLRGTGSLGKRWLVAMSLLAGCTAITGGDLRGGIGSRCEKDADCHASSCFDGLCSRRCSADLDCPKPAICLSPDTGSGRGGQCHLPLSVTAFYIGVGTAQEGWSLTHHEGLLAAQKQLGYLRGGPQGSPNGIAFGYKDLVFPEAIASEVATAVAGGAELIIANSFSHRDAVLQVARQYADRPVRFLTCAGFEVQPPNVGSYFGYMEQAWYVAGRTSALKASATSPRLGFIGSFITPEVVRHINAFARGAQSVKPGSIVEVRWLGFWFDYNAQPTFSYKASFMPTAQMLYAEELLTAQLIEAGAEVIAHQADNQRPVQKVHEWLGNGLISGVFSLGNDNRYACYSQGPGGTRGAAYRGCLGSAYWNWGPLYSRILDDIHRQTWQASNIVEPLSSNAALSVAGFELTPELGDPAALAVAIQSTVNAGPSAVFAGPLRTTGQRADLPAGQSIRYDPTDPNKQQEWRTLCWFVQGLVQKSDPNDPQSADEAALVPDGSMALPPGRVLLSPPGLPTGQGLSCKGNV